MIIDRFVELTELLRNRHQHFSVGGIHDDENVNENWWHVMFDINEWDQIEEMDKILTEKGFVYSQEYGRFFIIASATQIGFDRWQEHFTKKNEQSGEL